MFEFPFLVPEILLRVYQVDFAQEVVSDLTFGDESVGCSCTGSGKTVMARTASRLLLREGVVHRVLVVVPQNQIKQSWTEELTVQFPPEEDTGFAVARQQDEILFGPADWTQGKMGRGALQPVLAFLSAHNPPHEGFVTSHSALGILAQEGQLPDDLTGNLLIVDEVQFAEEKNNLGAAIQGWKDRGGKVLYLSATLFRSTGQIPLPADLIPVYRSLAEHTASGLYSPRRISIESKRFSYQASQLKHLQGDVLPPGDLRTLAEEIVQEWEDRGRPWTTIAVPPKGAERWAHLLEGKFQTLGVGVLNAVGPASKVQKPLDQMLASERLAAREGRPSKFRILIVCRRMDMGTDWPWCSLFINLGMPGSLLLILQRLGRTLRSKQGLNGYNPQHADTASLLFMLPKQAGGTWEQFETRHRDHVLMVACAAQDHRTSQEYMADVYRRLGDAHRQRSGNKPQNRARWNRIASAIGMAIEDLQWHLAKMKVAALLVGKTNPTDDELRGHLGQMGLTDPEIQDCFLVRDLRYKLGNPKIIQRLDAMVTSMVEGKRTSRRIVRDELHQLFDDVGDEIVSDNASLMQDARATQAILSEFTGDDAKKIEAKLHEALLLPEYTKDEVLDLIRAHIQLHGNPPTIRGSATDVTGLRHATWYGINKHCREKLGTTLVHLVEEVILASGKAQEQVQFESLCNQQAMVCLVEASLHFMKTNPGKRFSLRQLDEHMRIANLDFGGRRAHHHQSSWACVLGHLVPSLDAFLIYRQNYTPDWDALGIDPKDPKWAAYNDQVPVHTPMGTTDPSAMGTLAQAVYRILLDGSWRTVDRLVQEVQASHPGQSWTYEAISRQLRRGSGRLMDPKHNIRLEMRSSHGVSEYRIPVWSEKTDHTGDPTNNVVDHISMPENREVPPSDNSAWDWLLDL